jgi:hypothetical protein
VIITPKVEALINEMVIELHLLASKEEEDDDEVRELADALSYLLRRYKNEFMTNEDI